MKTQQLSQNDTLFVTLEGQIDFETHEHTRRTFQKLATDTVHQTHIIDFEKLDFVGSCGISNFLTMLIEHYKTAAIKPHFINVKSEFRRLLQHYDANRILPLSRELTDQTAFLVDDTQDAFTADEVIIPFSHETLITPIHEDPFDQNS